MENKASGESVKTISLALDYVEMGNDDENSHGRQDRVSKELPPGVTSGMLYRDVIRIAWPSLVELTLTQLASMVDMMMVGQLGPWALTAVGLTNQPKFLLMAVFMSMNTGATALVARCKGAGDREKANVVLRQALLLTLCLSSVLSLIGYFLAPQMVSFMGAKEELVFSGATTYLRIQMIGFVLFALTTTITASLRGVGDSRTAMIYNLMGNIVNVILNYMLIYGHFGFPKLGVAGASLATIIGQGFAFFMAVFAVTRKGRYLHLRFSQGFRPDPSILGRIANVGIPAMLEQLVMRLGIIFFTRTVASLGTVPYAAHQVCTNIQALSFMNGQAFAVSATSLMGQSLGKKRPDMAQAYTRHTRRLGLIVSIALAAFFFVFGRNVVQLYSPDEQVILMGAEILKMVAFVQPFQCSQLILAGSLRGAGDTRTTAVIIFFTVLLVRPLVAYFNVNVLEWGLKGAWIATVTDQLIRSFLVLLRFNSGKWKQLRV